MNDGDKTIIVETDRTIVLPEGDFPRPRPGGGPPQAPPPESGDASGLGSLVLRYYRAAILLFAGLLFLGVSVLFTLPRTEDPEFDVSDCKIVTIFPGASPDKVERLITEPIEDAVSGVDGVRSVESESSNGLSVLSIELDPASDPATVVEDIDKNLATAAGKLPEGSEVPELFHFNAGDIPVLIFALVGSEDRNILGDAAERLADELKKVRDVSSVEVEARPPRRITVEVDPGRLAQVKIPLVHVIEVLSRENASFPGGKLRVGSRQLLLESPNELRSIAAIGETPIGNANGSLVRLRDVAAVEDGWDEDRYFARWKGQAAVLLDVHKRPNTDTTRVARGVLEALEALRAKLPPGIEVHLVNDRGASVELLLGGLGQNALGGAALVVAIVGLFLGIRQAAIVSISIPFSLLLAMVVMQTTGIDLNQISIFGLALALGSIVDASMVVIENISDHIAEGHSLFEAVTEGVDQVALPVLTSTLTTVAVFVPMLFLSGDIGRFIRPMPLTVSYALLASAAVALLVIPLLCYALWKWRPPTAPVPTVVDRYPAILEGYGWVARLALRNRLVTMALVLAAFVAAVQAIPKLGVEFFPKAEKSIFLLNVRLPRGASLAATDAIVRDVEAILRAEPDVVAFTANIGKGSPQVYYNVAREQERSNYAQILVALRPELANAVEAWVGTLQPKLRRIAGATVEPKILQQGPASDAAIEVRLFGADRNALAAHADAVFRRISEVPGVIDLRDDMGGRVPRLAVDLDREKAARLGIDSLAVARTVFAAVSGVEATRYRQTEDEVPIVVRVARRFASEVSDLERIDVPTQTGEPVPLGEVARIREELAFSQLNRRDSRRSVSVQMGVSGRLASAVQADIESRLADLPIPQGLEREIGGEGEERAESFGGLRRALVFAILAVYGILALQFNSFVQPFVILGTVPFGVIGAVVGLGLTGNPFGFTAFIGIVSLTGIVINDSILLADFANHAQRVEGKGQYEALLHAGSRRFQPVVLTSLSTILGLVPLGLWGGSLWSPLANALMFGLAFSTVLILVVLPVLYSLLVREGERERRYRLVPALWQRLWTREG